MADKKYFDNPESDGVLEEKLSANRFLVLHNDDVHTFDYVIESLINVCDLEPLQAEQCTYLIHYKGKCDVKKGGFTYLKPYKQALIDKGLEVTID